MVSQQDLERERELARIRVERDQLSRLHSARQEGYDEGFRRGYEEGQRQALVRAIHALNAS